MKNLHLVRVLLFFLKMLPKKFKVEHSEMTNQPFFVIGSGRNGSTMLNRMLNQHSQLFLPSEQFFLGPIIFKFHYYNYAIWRDLVKIIVGELIPSGGSHTWNDGSLPDMKRLYKLSKEKKNLQYLIDVIFRANPECSDSAIWGDTSPLNARYLREILHAFPKGKYIFLIRDGRDVVTSYYQAGTDQLGEYALPAKAAQHWMYSIEMYDYLRCRVPVKLVKYEELVVNTEEVLSEICAYLNQTYEPSLTQFHENIPNSAFHQQGYQTNLKKEVFTSSVGNYKRDLPNEFLSEIMPIIKSGLEKFGYI